MAWATGWQAGGVGPNLDLNVATQAAGWQVGCLECREYVLDMEWRGYALDLEWWRRREQGEVETEVEVEEVEEVEEAEGVEVEEGVEDLTTELLS